MPCSRIGESVPDVISPPSSIAIPWRGMPLSSMRIGTSFSSGPCSRVAAELLDAGEVLVERARPGETRFDRRAVRTDVVAVQRVARLEPERVARAEAAGRDAALEDRVPEPHGIVGRAAELAAALARVAGARDEAADAEHLVLAERERLELDPKPLERARALDREQRPVVRDVVGVGERGVVGLDGSTR